MREAGKVRDARERMSEELKDIVREREIGREGMEARHGRAGMKEASREGKMDVRHGREGMREAVREVERRNWRGHPEMQQTERQGEKE